MEILIECFLIGLISIICCQITYFIAKKNKKYYKQDLILCFLFGFLLHYLIRSNNITDLYCKKVCYGDKCIMICNK
jgi:hypothetical protein